MEQNGFKISTENSPYGIQRENGRPDVSSGPKLSNGHSFAENLIAAADSQHSSDSEELEALDGKINPVYSSQSPSPGRTSASESPEAGTSPGYGFYKPHEVSRDTERFKSQVSNPREFYTDSYSAPRDYFKSKESDSFDYFSRENSSPTPRYKMNPEQDYSRTRTENRRNDDLRNPFLDQGSDDNYRREPTNRDYFQDNYGFQDGSENRKFSNKSEIFSSGENSFQTTGRNPVRDQQVILL